MGRMMISDRLILDLRDYKLDNVDDDVQTLTIFEYEDLTHIEIALENFNFERFPNISLIKIAPSLPPPATSDDGTFSKILDSIGEKTACNIYLELSKLQENETIPKNVLYHKHANSRNFKRVKRDENFLSTKTIDMRDVVPNITDHAQILKIEKYDNFEQIQKSLEDFNFKKFHKIFAIVIKISQVKDVKKFLKYLNKKTPGNREFFLQISSSTGQRFYKKSKNSKFIEVLENQSSGSFDIRTFCKQLSLCNSSLVDVDLNKILANLNVTTHEQKVLFLKKIYVGDDEILQNIFMAFYSQKTCKIRRRKINFNFSALWVAAKQVFREKFLKFPKLFTMLVSFEEWMKFVEIAQHKNLHESLHKVERRYYDCLPSAQSMDSFHANISAGNKNEVEKFVMNFPGFKFCFDSNGKCALEKAIDSKKFEIYSFLMSKFFMHDNQEILTKKIDNLSDFHKSKIKEENLKVVAKNPDALINILELKIDTFASEVKLGFADIRKMLKKLVKIEENLNMLEITSQSDVKIIFIFKTKSVNALDPTSNEHTMGVAYSGKGELYVAKNYSENQRYGTFTHELMHFVIYSIYENNCLPYCKADTVREAGWKKIVSRIKRFSYNNLETTDNIIKWVFLCYAPGDKQNLEVAVRVNDMMAFYHDNDAKIKELELLFPDLFSCMREKVLADLKIPNVYRMIKLNNDFGLIQKIEDSELQVESTENSEILNLATEQVKRVLIVTNVPQLMLSKVSQEIKNLPQTNKLNLKAKNIFVDAKVLDQKHVKDEFEALIETTNVDRIIVNFKSILNKTKTEISCFFVTNEGITKDQALQLNLNRIEFNIQWKDLTEKTQKFLLEKSIKFQEENVKLFEVLSDAEKSITLEILTILCSESEIQVNCDPKAKKVEKFIKRTVQMKKEVKTLGKKEPDLVHEDFTFENFIVETQNDPILVISDVAGSGKTTLLSKIHEVLMKSFPQHFIIFIILLNYVKELKEGVGDCFTEFIAKILKFNALERQIFMQKYSKGEVKIHFDAFDEISPNCKQNTTKLFQLFDKRSGNQIFITTRTHLEDDLERDLKVLANRIKILTEEEQIKFLEESWGNSDRDLVKKCAEMLVRKISEIISWRNSVIGIPLIVQSLAEAFKSKIDENFDRKIQRLDILSVYEKIIDTSFDILSSRFPQKPVKNQRKSTSLLQIHQFLAICLLFSEEFANLLGFNHDEDEWSFEEIARSGLIKYDKDGKFHFNHQTYAEFLIAVFLFHLLKTVKKLSPVQLDFIFQVLTKRNFDITRMFLDSMLNRVEKVQDLKNFNLSREICEKVKNEKNFLNVWMDEKLFNIFEFFALAVKESDVELFKEVIELKDGSNATILMRVLPIATNLSNFEKFLDEVLNFYSENIFDDFLSKIDKRGDTILHLFAWNCMNRKVFECFWNKVENSFEDENKLKKYLLVKEMFDGNALLLSIARRNEISFSFFFEEVYCKYFCIKEFAYETDNNDANLLHKLAQYGSVSIFKSVFEKLKPEFLPEEFQNFVKLKSEYGNLLHCAVQNKDKESVQILVDFIEKEVGREEVKKMLSELNKYNHLPIHWAVKCLNNNLEEFKFFFSLYIQNFNKAQILEFLGAKDLNGMNILHYAALHLRSKEVFEFAWTKIKGLIEDKEELKAFLLLKGFGKRNVLLESVEHENENIFCFLFDEVFCKFFKIKEFAYETDEDGKNLLHHLAEKGSVSMLKIVLEKLKGEFSPEKFKNFIKLKSKNGENLLHLAARAAQNGNRKSVEFIVDFLKNEFGSEEVKKMMSELDDCNHLPIHWAAECLNDNLKYFESFLSLYERFFNFDELKAFLTTPNYKNENIFTLMRKMNLMFRKPEHSEWNKIFNENRNFHTWKINHYPCMENFHIWKK